MPCDPEEYLFDMLDSCQFLLDFTAGRTLEQFKRERRFRSVAERELHIIGEALLRLSKVASTIAARISEHRLSSAFGISSSTVYSILNATLVWNRVEGKLPTLRQR